MKSPYIRFTISTLLCFAAATFLVRSPALAESSDPPITSEEILGHVADTSLSPKEVSKDDETSAPRIKPESIVRFTQGGIVCLTQDALLEITLHSMNGEKTKVAAMQMSPENPDGPCTMLDPTKTYKVLSVQYNNPEMPELGLLEIVGEKAKAANGGWAYTVGVEVVKTRTENAETSASPQPTPAGEEQEPTSQATSDQASKHFYVKRNQEFRLGDYSYIITGVRVGSTLGSRYLHREKASDGSTYLFVNYFVRNNGNEVAERPSDDFWIMDNNGRKYWPDKRATAAIPPDFAPQELQPGVSHKALTIFEVPRTVAKSNFGIIIGEKGVAGTDRKLAKLAGSFSWPTPTPVAAKSKAMRHRTGAASRKVEEPVYPSQPVGPAPSHRKTKAELEAYRRRLEQDWDKEVARREKEEAQSDEDKARELYLQKRLGRPPGAHWGIEEDEFWRHVLGLDHE